MQAFLNTTDVPEQVVAAVKQTLALIDIDITKSLDTADLVAVFSAEDALEIVKQVEDTPVAIIVLPEEGREGALAMADNYPERVSCCFVVPQQEDDTAYMTHFAKLKQAHES